METLCVNLAPIGRKLLARGKAVSRKFFNRNICFGCSVVIGLIAGKKMGRQKDGEAENSKGGAAQRFWEASSWTCSGVSSPR